MRKIIVSIVLLAVLFAALPARAQEVSVNLYLLPIETVSLPDGSYSRGPMYFAWGDDPNPPGIPCRWSMMDYGFTDYALLAAFNISAADRTALIAHADVYEFPDNLDQNVTPGSVSTFFEAINLPTDWLTASTTYRELLRQTAGMMQFNQRYGGISGGHSVFESATLESRLRDMTAQEQAWFRAAVTSFGYDGAAISSNTKLRQLVKQAGSFWIGKPFYLGGWEF